MHNVDVKSAETILWPFKWNKLQRGSIMQVKLLILHCSIVLYSIAIIRQSCWNNTAHQRVSIMQIKLVLCCYHAAFQYGHCTVKGN